MARKKKEPENETEETTTNENGTTQKPHSDFGHEVWGIIYLSIGVLVLISLFSHFTSTTGNVLGPYLGTSLAAGLIWLFGSIPTFFFPAVIGYIGVTRLCGIPLRVRPLLLWSGVTLQFCILLAIFHLPAVALNPDFAVSSNNVGMFFVNRLLRPIFGAHRFGPYFICSLTLFLTTLAGFKVNPKRVFAICWLWMQKVVTWFMHFVNKTKEKMEQEKAAEIARAEEKTKLLPKIDKKELEKSVEQAPLQEAPTEEPKNETKRIKAKAAIAFAAAEAAVQDAVAQSPSDQQVLGAEDEARRRLEEELAAFRARKRDPIQIMTIETPELPEAEEESAPEEMASDGTLDKSEITIGEVALPVEEDELDEGEDDEAGASYGGDVRKKSTNLPLKPYEIPEPEILPEPPSYSNLVDKEIIEKNSMILEKTLMNFGVEGKVVFVSPGPVVTRYEIELAPGIKVSRVVALHDDISMAVNGQRIRIEAPIPGKSAVGIELPNPERQIVHFKHILMSDAFRKTKSKIPVIVGTNISGAAYVTDITKMPHVLIAGQTGSGKSVCINSLICSILMTKKPEELRLIMIDPKKVELAFYEGIPHLLSPVVTESKEAVKALQWSVNEMERRYRVLAKVGARNLDSFNQRIETGKLKGILPDSDNKLLPFIVIIVDELADLMMTASKDVEGLIQRIAQLARAVGIHLIVATQRPSVDIITGPIKANLTSRISFRTIQSTDSRTILGHVGAEKLLGMGDMLFLRNGAPEIERFHGAFISEEDVEIIVSKVKTQFVDIERIESFHDATGGSLDDEDSQSRDDGDRDELFEEAARTIVSIGQGSTSLLQRRMKIGYARAGRLMDELERAGFVGPPDGSKAREVHVMPDELDELLIRLH